MNDEAKPRKPMFTMDDEPLFDYASGLLSPASPLALHRGKLIWNLIEPRKGAAFYGYLKPKVSRDGISIKDIGIMYKREF